MTIDLTQIVTPLRWVKLGDAWMASDQFFNAVAICKNPAEYDRERAARVLAALDAELLGSVVEALRSKTLMDADNSNGTYLDSAARAILAKLGVTP